MAEIEEAVIREALERSLSASLIAENYNERAAEEIAYEMMHSGGEWMEFSPPLVEIAYSFAKQFDQDFCLIPSATDDLPARILPSLIVSALENVTVSPISRSEFDATSGYASKNIPIVPTWLCDEPRAIEFTEMQGKYRAFVTAPFVLGSRRGVVCFAFQWDGYVEVVNPVWEGEPSRHIYSTMITLRKDRTR